MSLSKFAHLPQRLGKVGINAVIGVNYRTTPTEGRVQVVEPDRHLHRCHCRNKPLRVYEQHSNDGAKGTDLLLPGATFSRRFDRPGTYDYNCAVHPYMTGRVVVQAK